MGLEPSLVCFGQVFAFIYVSARKTPGKKNNSQYIYIDYIYIYIYIYSVIITIYMGVYLQAELLLLYVALL